MKKALLILCLSVVYFVTLADTPTKLVVANGGKPTANPPIWPSLQVIDLAQGTSIILDEVQTLNVKDLKVFRNKVFLAAGDSVFVYNLNSNSNSLVTKIFTPSVTKILPYFDTLYVGREGFFIPTLSAYRISTGALIRAEATVNGTVTDIILNPNHIIDPPHEVIVSWNFNPPAGIPLDSTASVTLFGISDFQSFTTTSLGVSGKNLLKTFPMGFLSLVGFKKNTLMGSPFPRAATFTLNPTLNIGLSQQFGLDDFRIIGLSATGNLGWYSLNNSVGNSNVSTTSFATFAIWSDDINRYYLSRSDGNSLNAIEELDSFGAQVRTLPAMQEPKFMAFAYQQFVSGIETEFVNQVSIYPNPVGETIFLQGLKNGNELTYSLLNAIGQVVKSGDLLAQLSVKGLSSGSYRLRISDKAGKVRVLPISKL